LEARSYAQRGNYTFASGSMKINKQPIFLKSVLSIGAVLVLSVLMMVRGTKDKREFYEVSGRITYLEKTYGELPNRSHGKYRYLQVENFPKVFEIFIGKDAVDFKPKYEKLDALKVGDAISVYYDINPIEDDPIINRLVFFIDKDNEGVFILGNKYNTLGNVILSSCVIFLGILIILKRQGKIT
jgi:hypothetical protein